MPSPGLLALTFVAAAITAIAWVYFVRTSNKDQAEAAAFWDFLIVLAGNAVPLSVWKETAFSYWAMAAYVVGSTVATWGVIAWRRRNENTDEL